MDSTLGSRSAVVHIRVPGTFDLGDYAAYLDSCPGAGLGFRADRASANTAEAVPNARPALRAAFWVEGTGEYVEASVRQAAPDTMSVEVDGPEDAVAPAAEQVRRVLSCDVDNSDFERLARADPVLCAARARHPGLRPVLFATPYEAACWAVVCQGLRMPQAAGIMREIARLHGRETGVGTDRVWAFPPAHALLRCCEPLGLSALKRQRLELVAEVAFSGHLDAGALRGMPLEEALAMVRRLPGIGPFSAELVLGRGAGHPDLFPVRETPLRRLIASVYGVADDDDAVERVAQRWKPYRSWGAFFLRWAYAGCRGCLR